MTVDTILLIVASFLVLAIVIIELVQIIRGKRPTVGPITIAFLLLILLFAVFLTYRASELESADWAQIILMIALVAVTGFYALSASKQADASVKMAEEMKEQRYAALRPIIDIVKWEVRYPRDVVKQEDDIRSGQLQGLPGILHNIGVGPAIDVYSFIQISDNERQFHVFGTLATGATTPEEELSLEQRDGHTILIAYYKDVYDNLFESSREVTVDRDKLSVNVGELKVRPLPKKEHTR